MYSWPQNYYPNENLFFQPQISILSEYWLRIYCVFAWIYMCMLSRSVVSDSLWPHGLLPTRLFCSWDFPGKNTGVGHHSLLQRIFTIQESNPSSLHCRWILYHLSHQGSPNVYQIRSDWISRSVVSDSLPPHESQHARTPCPSPTPGVHSDSRSSSQWCHPAISSSVVPFSSCPQSLPAPESFPMSQLFAWGGQSTGVSALASFLPKKSHK